MRTPGTSPLPSSGGRTRGDPPAAGGPPVPPEPSGSRERRSSLGAAASRVAARPLRLAHRGDWRQGPENSLAAFRAALANPACDGLELDVRRSKDGVPIVLHDASLARVQGRPTLASALTAEQLEEAGVPTLASVLAEVPHRFFLDVELKENLGRSVVEVLAAGRGPALSHAVVSSFDEIAIRGVLALAAGWPCWLNTVDLDEATLDRAVRLGCRGVSAAWRSIDDVSMARAADRGLDVAGWTIRRRATVARLGGLGVAAVCVEGAALDG